MRIARCKKGSREIKEKTGSPFESQLLPHFLPREIHAGFRTLGQTGLGTRRGCGRSHRFTQARMGVKAARIIGQHGRVGIEAGRRDTTCDSTTGLALGRDGREGEARTTGGMAGGGHGW